MGILLVPTPREFLRDFRASATRILEPGMVFHLLALGDILDFSEMVAITTSGPEALTDLERKLLVK